MTHTPGPWAKWQLSPDSDPGMRWIVTTEDGETEVCGIIENEDDADILAAAPALLAALEAAAAELAFIHENHLTARNLEPLIDRINAAITGGKP